MVLLMFRVLFKGRICPKLLGHRLQSGKITDANLGGQVLEPLLRRAELAGVELRAQKQKGHRWGMLCVDMR